MPTTLAAPRTQIKEVLLRSTIKIVAIGCLFTSYMRPVIWNDRSSDIWRMIPYVGEGNFLAGCTLVAITLLAAIFYPPMRVAGGILYAAMCIVIGLYVWQPAMTIFSLVISLLGFVLAVTAVE